MKVAAASVISSSAWAPPMVKRMRMTSAFLRKLSLNAEKNWHQNKGAKRREVIKCVAMRQFRFMMKLQVLPRGAAKKKDLMVRSASIGERVSNHADSLDQQRLFPSAWF